MGYRGVIRNCLVWDYSLLYVVPLSNGDPACWRPAWGGVRCAAMVGGRARFLAGGAASLRMTREGQGRGVKNKMPYQLV